MKNRNLFLTLSEIAEATQEGRSLRTIPELGSEGTHLGVAVAKDMGLVEDFFGFLDLTAKGEQAALGFLLRHKCLIERVAE